MGEEEKNGEKEEGGEACFIIVFNENLLIGFHRSLWLVMLILTQCTVHLFISPFPSCTATDPLGSFSVNRYPSSSANTHFWPSLHPDLLPPY